MDIKKYYKLAKQDAEEYLGKMISEKAFEEFGQSWIDAQPKTQEEVIEFYKNSNYIEELAKWHNEDKINSVRKVYKALSYIEGNKFLDFGAGIGSDSMMLKDLGVDVHYYEINEGCKEFFKFRLKKHNLAIPIIKGKEFDGNSPFDCIMFLDVIGHIFNSFQFLTDLSKHTKYLLFTVDLGVHDKRKGNHPQHYDYSRSKVFKHLENLGFVKIKLNMAFPPQLWQKV